MNSPKMNLVFYKKKEKCMTKIMALLSLFFMAQAFAAVDCTQEPKSKWKDQAEFKKELELTYKIKVFKVTQGNCYEIYGYNKENKKVEIYFNPVTGAKVKERIE
jgi:hypothetical protein